MYLFHPLLSSFNKVYRLSPPLKTALRKHLQYKKLPRGYEVLKTGEVCDSIYFVLHGLLRTYSIQNGEEITTRFYQQKDVVIGWNSLLAPRPSKEYMETLVETEVIFIERKALLQICKQFPEFTFIVGHFTERSLSQANTLLALLRKGTADERLRALSKLHPRLMKLAKVKYLAPFLNMTPETFSRSKHKKV